MTVIEIETPDPLADLEDWLDDDTLALAATVVTAGPPEDDGDRVALAHQITEELNQLDLAQAHLRVIEESWRAVQRHPAAFRVGLAEIKRELFEMAKARRTYRAAVMRLRATSALKQARGELLRLVLDAWRTGALAPYAAISAACEQYVAARRLQK